MNYYTYKNKLIISEKNIETYSNLSNGFLQEIKRISTDKLTIYDISNFNNIYIIDCYFYFCIN